MSTTVERYLDRLEAKDWPALAETLADSGFERVGPFSDLVVGKQPYLEFLEGIVSKLDEYTIRVRRIRAAEGTTFAEVNEAFFAEGAHMDFPEVLVFDHGPDGLITKVQVYLMRPGEEPPVPGGKATTATTT